MKLCIIENCNKDHFGLGYCIKHYKQFKRYGEIPKRTRRDANEFIIDGDICWVILYDKNNKEKTRAKFLSIYYNQICNPKLKWHLHNYGYVGAIWTDENNIQQHIFLHEAIIQLSDQEIPDGYEIDHKDGNKLNCLDNNLRICTKSQNGQNRGKNKNNTSGYKGVTWDKACKKWHVRITINNQEINLGNFKEIEEAAETYNSAALKYHGEFAVLNNIV